MIPPQNDRYVITGVVHEALIEVKDGNGVTLWTHVSSGETIWHNCNWRAFAGWTVTSAAQFMVYWENIETSKHGYTIMENGGTLTIGGDMATSTNEPRNWLHQILSETFKKLDDNGEKYPTTILVKDRAVEGTSFRGIPIVENKYQEEKIKLC